MFRNAILIAVCVLVHAELSGADERPDKAWSKYLEGSWKYEISDGTKGDGVWTFEADGQSMIGRFKEGDTTGVEVGGWQPDAKIVMVNGYDSKGNYWQLEYKHFSDKGGRGPIRGKADVGEYSGDFEATIVNQDRWGWTIKGKTSAGEDFNLSATFKRVKQSTFTGSESEQWLKFFVGDWKRERELWKGDEKVVDTATWSCELAADGKATIERGKWIESGETWVSLAGSGPGKIHFERGTSSSGSDWSVDFSRVDAKTLRGKASGVAEGKGFEGTITLTMTSDDSYMVTWEARFADGEIRKAKATNTRIKTAQ